MVKSTRDYFDRSAGAYQQSYAEKNSRGDCLRKIYLTYLVPYTDRRKVLEIGCGPGTFLRDISAGANEIHAVDFSEKMIAEANRLNTGAKISLADASKLPYENASFDTVYSIRTFQHIQDRAGFLDEAKRVVRPNGIIVFDFMSVLSPVGFIRGLLSFTPFFVYLHADFKNSIFRQCRDRGMKLIKIIPVQFLVDASNLEKYLPELFVKPLIHVSEKIEHILMRCPALSVFALRQLIVLQSQDES